VDSTTARLAIKRLQDVGIGVMAPLKELVEKPLAHSIALVSLQEVMDKEGELNLPDETIRYALEVTGLEDEMGLETLGQVDPQPIMILLRPPDHVSRLHASRRVFEYLRTQNSTSPVIHWLSGEGIKDTESLVLKSGMEVGPLLIDGLGDGVMIQGPASVGALRTMSFSVLQGSRMRNTKTEFISCPSCGRTLFDLQETTEQIRRRTGHLPGVAIAVMGCIVNGPGEMADADFGYVGGAPGKVDLYVGKEVVERGIPNDKACDRLIELIKAHGRWEEPSAESPVVEKPLLSLAKA